MTNPRSIGRKVAKINMATNFEKITNIEGIAVFKCNGHKDMKPMTRKEARKHYIKSG